MSGISFPSSSTASLADSVVSMEDSSYYAPFPSGSGNSASGNAPSGFMMNPASHHPPRTPRASIISNGGHSVYSSAVYEAKEAENKELCEVEDREDVEVDFDEEDERVQQAEKRIRKEEVWKELVLTSNGRDKSFKLIQYTIKTLLVFHLSITRLPRLNSRAPGTFEAEVIKRLSSVASHLSLTRKQLLLFNWLYPLVAILSLASPPVPTGGTTSISKKGGGKQLKGKQQPFLHTLLHAPPPVLLDLVQAISDDVYTWSRIGLLGPKVGSRAARFSDWCWFLATLVGLIENGVERNIVCTLQSEVESRLYNESMAGPSSKSTKTDPTDDKELRRLQRENFWLAMGRSKLICDLVFVSYDIFRIKRAKPTIQALTGLGSAILSAAKLYDKHRNALVKSALTSAP